MPIITTGNAVKFGKLGHKYKYTPGNNIPIYGPEKLKETNCDIGLILGWNFAESIKANNSNFKGTWITPLPEYEEDVRV